MESDYLIQEQDPLEMLLHYFFLITWREEERQKKNKSKNDKEQQKETELSRGQQTLVHFADQLIDLVLAISGVSPILVKLFLPKQCFVVWLVESKGAEQTVNLFEMRTDSSDLVHNVFYT